MSDFFDIYGQLIRAAVDFENKLRFRKNACPLCSGRGHFLKGGGLVSLTPTACPLCKGAGVIELPPEACPECGGGGKIIVNDSPSTIIHLTEQTCPSCHGSGKKEN